MKKSAALEEEIFLEGLGVAPAQRQEFVDSRCGDDSGLAARVIALLRGYENNSAYLEKPPASNSPGANAKASAQLRDHAPGDRIGFYRLVERIGEGGCGVVYLAEQEEPVRRNVALKVIKLGLDTHEFVARFEAERQALALMDHAAIARVYDAGATPAGRPYFAMELVRGIPITRYCDDHQATTAERLNLFVTVCHAVQHAHQKGVIHRDLKPSNILVGTDNGQAVPKVIDFGIAKALNEPLTDKVFSSRLRAFVGTPAYTSPEQVDGQHGDVDTRSDIYSLGVVLYELLTGHPPFDREIWEQAGLDETRRLIREVEAPRPSVRVEALSTDEQGRLAARRGEEPSRISALLRVDLDWIVMRCLEKDRTRRYETVNALAMDVRRYLDHEPVLARPPSGAYRVRKFIRRHRTGALATGLVAASLVAGLILAGVLLAREKVARDRAEIAERAEARLRQQADSARQVEVRRAAAAVIDLATERLAQGRGAEGLGYLAAAARRDPTNPQVAPLLASVLTGRLFVLPETPLAARESPVLGLVYSSDGSHLLPVWEDGTVGWIDLADRVVKMRTIPGPRFGYTRMQTKRYLLLYSPEGTIRSLNRDTGEIAREIRFEFDAMGCRAVDDSGDLFSTKLTSNKVMVGDAGTGETIGEPVPYEGYFGAGAKWIAWSLNGTGAPTDQLRFRRTEGDRSELTVQFPLKLSHGKLAFSPDGRRLATFQQEGAAGDVFLRIWSLPDGVSIARSPRLGHGGFAFYDRTGRYVFCWGRGIEMFDAETAQPIARMPSAGVFVDETRYVFSPDGRLFATWGAGDVVNLWDIAGGGTQVAALRHGGIVGRVLFSGNGRVILTSSDTRVRLWNATTGELIAEPAAHLRTMPAVALSPDGTQLAVGTGEGAVYQFSVGGRGARPLELGREGGLPVAFLPQTPTQVLAMGITDARVIDFSSGAEVSFPEAHPRRPDRKAVGALLEDDSRGRLDYPEPIQSAFVRRDGKVAVVRTSAGRWQSWWLAEGHIGPVVEIDDYSAEMAAAIFSEQQDLVALSRADHLRVWRLTDGQPASPPIRTAINFGFARFASFSPDGKRIVVGSNQGRARIWNVATGAEEVDFGQQPTRALIATFSPDGRHIVAGSRVGGVQLWDADSGKRVGREQHHRGFNGQGVFSPDGRKMAGFANSSELQIQDVDADGAVLRSVEVEGTLRTARFSPNGRRLATATIEGTAQVWDVTTGLPVTEPLQHGAVRVVDVEFSPDGKYLRTESAPDGKFRFWSVPPGLPTGQSTPTWLIELAELCAGTRPVEKKGADWVAREPEAVAKLRQQINELPPDAPYAEWGRWFIADRKVRSVAPGFRQSALEFSSELGDDVKEGGASAPPRS